MFAFSIHMAYYYLVQSFGDVQAVAKLVWSAKVASIVLNEGPQSQSVSGFGYCPSSAGMPGTMPISDSDMELNKPWIKSSPVLKWVLHLGYVVYLGYGVSAAIDVIITVALVSILIRYSTGMERTENVASRLIQYILSTGTLTSMRRSHKRSVIWDWYLLPQDVIYTISFLTL
ncbi:hypothetical protein D9757_000007 [Collybiopsis confluens]|uniref:DUF6534 domain-containing protein n=1 Tax=Collybiopsis confluens TaxID=2823264 RepID=A0A8H5MH69_9AGAR|nr:hypothetical protein D9757_000007 [Collybiopsis confluens]